MSSSTGRRRRRSLLNWLLFLPPGRRHSFWPGIVVTVVLTVINAGCQHWGAYERLEWADLDRLQSVNSAANSKIVLVTIGDDDYANPALFGSQRPLKADVLIRLVGAACQLNRAAVGVNIFTDTWTDEHRGALSSQIPPDCDVVWAREAVPIEGERDKGLFRLANAAGGEAAFDSLCSGLTPFRPGRDGVVRDYLLQVLVKDDRTLNSVSARYATMVSAMATKGTRCGFSGRLPIADADRAARIRFSPRANFRRIPAGVLLSAGGESSESVLRSLRALDRDGQAFMLIGATFRDSSDVYMTPIGSLPGVEVLAHALATAKSNQPIRASSWHVSWMVTLVAGILLVLVVWASRLRLLFGAALSLTLAVAATLGICSYLFSYYGYFLSVFVSTAGAAIGAIVNMTSQSQSLSMRKGFETFRAEFLERIAKRTA